MSHEKITQNDLKAMARSHTRQAIDTIIDVMQSDQATPSAKLSAAEAILTRAWGKQPTDGKDNDKQQFIQQVVDFIERLDDDDPK